MTHPFKLDHHGVAPGSRQKASPIKKFDKEMEHRQRDADGIGKPSYSEFVKLQTTVARGLIGGESWQNLLPQYLEAEKIRLSSDWSKEDETADLQEIEYFAGRVERITIAPEAFVRDAGSLFDKYPCLRHLNVPLHATIPVDFFRKKKVIQDLYSISADHCQVTDSHLRDIAKYGGNLHWLSFANGRVTSKGIGHLAQLPDLRYANLAGNPIDPLDVVEVESGEVISVSQPSQEIRALESRLARQRSLHSLPWFHREAPDWREPNLPPNRFLLRYFVGSYQQLEMAAAR